MCCILAVMFSWSRSERRAVTENTWLLQLDCCCTKLGAGSPIRHDRLVGADNQAGMRDSADNKQQLCNKKKSKTTCSY